MSFRRQLSWASALRDLRADRAQIAPEVRRANVVSRAYTEFAAKRALPLRASFVAAGKFDCAAIMKAAIVAAQARRSVTGEAWGLCLSAALKGTWQVAKAAQRASIG